MQSESRTNLWYRDGNSEDSLIVCSFSRIVAVSSPLGPVNNLLFNLSVQQSDWKAVKHVRFGATLSDMLMW